MIEDQEPDVITLPKTKPEDLWIYDKFILARRLGYICGPKSMDVPKSGTYIIRPAINFMGMGAGAKFVALQKSTYKIPDGFFWCEIFKGKHLSVDYYKKKQVLCVEGFRNKNDLMKWKIWRKTEDKIPYPKILKNLKGNYDWINVEYIDGKIIEVHLRKNPDFEGHSSDYVIPVWRGQKVKPKKDQRFIKVHEFDRLGYYVSR